MKQLVLILLSCLCFSYLKAQESFNENSSSSNSILEEKKSFQKLLDSSNIFYNRGEFSKSLKLNIQILNKAYDLDDPYYIHQGYRYLAYDYLILNDTILAMDSFKKSEKYAKLSKNDTATALTYMDLGNVYSTYEEFPNAYNYFNKSIHLFKKLKDSVGIAKAHYNMVLSYLDEEDYDNAYTHILKANEINKFGNDISFQLNLDLFLGEYYYYKKNFKEADILFKGVIKEAKRDSLNVELENAYFLLSESLFEQKRFEEAYENLKIYDEYSDINSGFYTSEERYSLSHKFQLDEYRKDIANANLNNQLQAEIVTSKTRLNIILIIVSICFLLLLIALYITSIKRIRLVKKLKIKNKEALEAKLASEKLSQAKLKFFSTVSHELRTPLYGVIGLSSILLEDESLKKHKKDLKFLKFSADYLLALINDVLHINKIDSKSIENEKINFNLIELIENITSSFEYMLIQNDNKIKIEISETIPELIKGDSIQLSQILINLISNACKFTENGTITIKADAIPTTLKGKTTIKFTIKDTGIGIAKEKQESIFDEFSQINAHTHNNRGTGLGLPIVKKLLALNKSNIKIESELGKGTTFTFQLTYKIIKNKVNKINAPVVEHDTLKNKKILIVEDNRINQIVTQKILEKQGILCTIAENGEEAVSIAQKSRYDLILMDINMPIKNGFEATEEIRTFNTKVPIIALTAVEIDELKNNIYQSGMNDIIVKPYDVTKFISCIAKNILQGPEDKSHLRAI